MQIMTDSDLKLNDNDIYNYRRLLAIFYDNSLILKREEEEPSFTMFENTFLNIPVLGYPWNVFDAEKYDA